MALSVCLACSTVYAAGLARCPHCTSPDQVEQGQPMPKITRQGGPSHEVDEFTDAHGITWRNAKDFTEEVPSSPGNSSETSTGKPPTSETQSKPARQPRARTTESRSKQGPAASSTADSTAGRSPADH